MADIDTHVEEGFLIVRYEQVEARLPLFLDRPIDQLRLQEKASSWPQQVLQVAPRAYAEGFTTADRYTHQAPTDQEGRILWMIVFHHQDGRVLTAEARTGEGGDAIHYYATSSLYDQTDFGQLVAQHQLREGNQIPTLEIIATFHQAQS